MRFRLLGLLILAVSVVSGSAHADSLVTAASFSGITNNYQFQAFDTSLGTLNSVSVHINGLLQATFETQVVLATTPTGPQPVPLPYTIEIDQSFASALGGFSSLGPGRYFFNGQSDGTGDPIVVAVPFFYGFTFDSVSQLTGSAPPSTVDGPSVPPTVFNGDLSSFENVLGGQIMGVTNLSLGPDIGTLGPEELTQSGSITVIFDYTPTAVNPPPGNPTPVPEPSSFMLLSTGAVGLLEPIRRQLLRR